MNRTSYTVSLIFDEVVIDEVIIDQHYRIKHPEMEDWIILELLKRLNNIEYLPNSKNDQFYYYLAEPVIYNNKPYRVILTIEKGHTYLGVINAFRVQEKKYGISL